MVQCCSTIHTVVHEFILNINLWVDPHAVTLHIESRQIHFFWLPVFFAKPFLALLPFSISHLFTFITFTPPYIWEMIYFALISMLWFSYRVTLLHLHLCCSQPWCVSVNNVWNSRMLCPVLRYWCLSVLFQTANLVDVTTSEEDRIRVEMLQSSHRDQIKLSVHLRLYFRLDSSHSCSKINVATLCNMM